MEDVPTFVTDEELVKLVVQYGLLFIVSIVASFLLLYRFAMWKKIKDEIKKRKDLTDIKHRSNGHHKHKVNHE